MQGSGLFQAIDFSAGLSWKPLSDPHLIYEAAMAASVCCPEGSHIECKESDMHWPFLPRGFTRETFDWPTGMCFIKLADGQACSFKLQRDDIMFCSKNGLVAYGLSGDGYKKQLWAESAASISGIEDLAEAAVRELKPMLPVFKLVDGSIMPDSEAIWLSPEAMAVSGSDIFTWLDCVAKTSWAAS